MQQERDWVAYMYECMVWNKVKQPTMFFTVMDSVSVIPVRTNCNVQEAANDL